MASTLCAAFEPRSRRPKTSPSALAGATIELIITMRKELSGQGLDAGPQTICWHLEHHHHHPVRVSAATVSRYLTRTGLVTRSRRRHEVVLHPVQADRPNERWQSGFIHWQLAGGRAAEIVSWLDDHSRYALSITACLVTTGEVTLATLRAAVAAHGTPAPPSPTTAWSAPPGTTAARPQWPGDELPPPQHLARQPPHPYLNPRARPSSLQQTLQK